MENQNDAGGVEFVPNWKVLSERYSANIKNLQDAKRYVLFCLEKEAKKICKVGLEGPSFIIDGKAFQLTKDGFRPAKDKRIKPAYIDEFK